MEIWIDLKDYEELYQISNLGRVKRKTGYQCKNERILKSVNNGTDYWCVTLSKNGKVQRFYVHRLVALSFLHNYENKDEVNHIDGNRGNNKLENLEWSTRSENHFHRYKVLNQKGVNHGKTGSKSWRSKPVLKYDKKDNFIERYVGVMEAQRQTGINESNIRSVIYGKSHTAGGYRWRYENKNTP